MTFRPEGFVEVAKGTGKVASVIMVTFNRWNCTLRSLTSVFRNTFLPHTLTVVDNGSWDETAERLRELRRAGKIDRLILLPKNRGIDTGKNFGLRASQDQANWYCCVDNDIRVSPYWLSYLCYVSMFPGLGIIGCNVQGFGLPDGLTGFRPTLWKTVEGVRLNTCPSIGGIYVISAATFEKLGFFIERGLYGLGDSQYWTRQRFHGLRSVYVGNVDCREMHDEDFAFAMQGGSSYRDFKTESHKAMLAKVQVMRQQGEQTNPKHYETKVTVQDVEEHTWCPPVWYPLAAEADMFNPKDFVEVAKEAGQRASVTMVTFNRWKLTERSLTSIFKNTFLSYILTIVDNGSWDETRGNLKELRRIGRIDRLILLPENRGIDVGKNFGLRATEGKAAWYCCIDNDIEISPYWLSYLCYTSELPGLGVIGCNVEGFGTPGGPTWFIPIHWKTVEGVILDGCPNIGGLYVVSASTLKALGFFIERGLFGLGDSQYGTRQRQHNLRSVYVRNVNCRQMPDEDFTMKDGMSYRDFKMESNRAMRREVRQQKVRVNPRHYETRVTAQDVGEYTWHPANNVSLRPGRLA